MSHSVRYSRFLLEFGAVCFYGVWGLVACLTIEAVWATALFCWRLNSEPPSPNFLKWQEKQRQREAAALARRRVAEARPLPLPDKLFLLGLGSFFSYILVVRYLF